jgi:FkbM family methyltransferase
MGLPAIERKTVLDLFPYFSKNPIVFDVGSNKGEFADLFVNNAAELHLFEPNELLLHYTMVKYCDKKNVKYCNDCVGHENTYVSFKCYTNENNGLSNCFDNPKWADIPGKIINKYVQTLDVYTDLHGVSHIDFLKIDVEGAEMFVLKGAEKLLSKKAIKFIQVEKAEHILLSGYTFENLTEYLQSFGYTILQTEDTENIIFAMEGFTQDWNGEFKKNTNGIKVETALEIGCFEGLTTNYICDNILLPGGRIICIDPLTDEYLPGHKDNEMFVGQYERFIRNTAGRPVELIRMKSREAHAKVRDYRFGLIYIDGDHTEEGVFMDGVLYWNQLREDGTGYMLFDDYGQSEETARGIDRFLETQKGNYELLVKDYQVLIRRKW